MGAEMTFRRFPQPLAVGKRAERFVPNSEKPAVACDGSNRLLLNALLSGLSHAIRRDDIPAANRYRGRLQQAAEPVAADTQLKHPLTKILLTSGLWCKSLTLNAMKRGSNCLISSIESSLCLHHDRPCAFRALDQEDAGRPKCPSGEFLNRVNKL